ncbi:molybdenum cofactor guanylyltransferase [Neobacillus sp. NRS-1170]|uniref:molybdenum cofactor guanylyltransferase n=1 Tax=Neobacillus sp. NRS-1170 TaxID=3233898 RepID=UPI003D277630
MKAAAIILSGGKSSRMGTNKALLKINEKTNIERIRDTLHDSFDDIILVTNDSKQYEFLNIKMAADHFPGKGPLAGLHAGLTVSEYDVNFIVACDMPFVSGRLAEKLVSLCGEFDAVVPVINGKQHPLFAAFKKGAAEKAAQSIETGNLRMKDLLERLHVLFVTENELKNIINTDIERVFFNMNHPEEYEDAKKWAKAEHFPLL